MSDQQTVWVMFTVQAETPASARTKVRRALRQVGLVTPGEDQVGLYAFDKGTGLVEAEVFDGDPTGGTSAARSRLTRRG